MVNLDPQLGWIKIDNFVTKRMINGSFKHLLKEPCRPKISDKIKFINDEVTRKFRILRTYKQYVAIKRSATRKFGKDSVVEDKNDSSGISTDNETKEGEEKEKQKKRGRPFKKVRGRKPGWKKSAEVRSQKNVSKRRQKSLQKKGDGSQQIVLRRSARNSRKILCYSCETDTETDDDESSEKSLGEIEEEMNKEIANELETESNKETPRDSNHESNKETVNKLGHELDKDAFSNASKESDKNLADKIAEEINESGIEVNKETSHDSNEKSEEEISNKSGNELEKDPLNVVNEELDKNHSAKTEEEINEETLEKTEEEINKETQNESGTELNEEILNEFDEELDEETFIKLENKSDKNPPNIEDIFNIASDKDLLSELKEEINEQALNESEEVDLSKMNGEGRLEKEDDNDHDHSIEDKTVFTVDVKILGDSSDKIDDEFIEKVLDEIDREIIEETGVKAEAIEQIQNGTDEVIKETQNEDDKFIKQTQNEADEFIEAIRNEADEVFEVAQNGRNKVIKETQNEAVEFIEEIRNEDDDFIEETQNKIDDESIEEISDVTDVEITDESESDDQLDGNIEDDSIEAIDISSKSQRMTDQLNPNNQAKNEAINNESIVRKEKPALKITSTEVIKPKYKIVRDVEKEKEKHAQTCDETSNVSSDDDLFRCLTNQEISVSNKGNDGSTLQVSNEDKESESDSNSDDLCNEDKEERRKKKKGNKRKHRRKSSDSEVEMDFGDSETNFSRVKNIEGRIFDNFESEEDKNDDCHSNELPIYDRKKRRRSKKEKSSEESAMSYILKNMLERKQRETDVNFNVEKLPVDDFVHVNNEEEFYSEDEEEEMEEELYERPKTLEDFAEIEDLTPLSPIILSNALTIEDLSENEEMFIMEVPTSINLKQYEGEYLSIKKNRLKIGDERYQLHQMPDEQITCVMRKNKKKSRFKAVNLNAQGSFVIKPSISESKEDVKPYYHLNLEEDDDNVPFPNNLKIRNPLLGTQEQLGFSPHQEITFATDNHEVKKINEHFYKRKKLKRR